MWHQTARRIFIALTIFSGLAPTGAQAHEFRALAISVAEQGSGSYRVTVHNPNRQPIFYNPQHTLRDLGVTLPRGCDWHGAAAHPAPETWSRRFSCTAGELRGELAVVGLETSRVDAVLLLQLSDRQESLVLSASEPSVELGHEPGETAQRSALGYLEVGTRHILAGWDHLAFVLGLVWLLVHRSHHPTCDRWQLARRLLAAITAFTLGHSASLAVVTLGGLPLAVEPIEALIALSVVLLARELVHVSSPTTTVETSFAAHPWRMASLFGLVHGCGFAGALTEIGLPPGTFAVALAAFNIGVELGQLAVVAGLLLILLPLFAGLPPRLRRYLTVTAGYCLGIVASAWTLARILAFWNK